MTSHYTLTVFRHGSYCGSPQGRGSRSGAYLQDSWDQGRERGWIGEEGGWEGRVDRRGGWMGRVDGRGGRMGREGGG